ncbi:MAG: ABC transporter permease [Clostridia bacterium]|nr:ABC transporter permease [Clostridia bacterium]
MFLYGIISGLGAIYILLKIVGALLGEFLFEGIDGILFSANIWAIIISIVLGFVTIYLSAFISAKRASKVNPIELLRNSAEIKIKPNKLKVPKIIAKLFKTGGILAYKNLKRSKKKYRTTVISIAVSVCIFITMNTYITNMFDISSKYYKDQDYNIRISSGREEVDLKQFLTLDGIEKSFLQYQEEHSNYFRIYDKTKLEPNNPYEEYFEGEYVGIEFVGLDDETFKSYVKKIGGDYEKLKDQVILIDDYEYMERVGDKVIAETRRIYNYKEGEEIKGRYGNSGTKMVDDKPVEIFQNDKEISFKIGKITDTKPYGRENSYYYGGYIVLNVDRCQTVNFKLEYVSIQSDNPDLLEQKIVATNNNAYVRNLEREAKENKSMLLVIEIFLYGFIGVITLIGVTNIFNTITSNMELRQKEFAMLKSIGMTKKEFSRMINLETVFYGTKSLLYGIILGTGGTLLLYNAIKDNLKEFQWPIIATVLASVSVFILIFIIMKYSVRKINKQNTIETIRKDNI